MLIVGGGNEGGVGARVGRVTEKSWGGKEGRKVGG